MLLDSNIIIIASKLVQVKLISHLRNNEKDLKTSIISQIEVLGYHQLKQVEKTFLENFFNAIPVIPLNDAVASKAIELRQRKPISLADAIIAATALTPRWIGCTRHTCQTIALKSIDITSDVISKHFIITSACYSTACTDV